MGGRAHCAVGVEVRGQPLSQFSPSAMWILRFELRSAGLATLPSLNLLAGLTFSLLWRLNWSVPAVSRVPLPSHLIYISSFLVGSRLLHSCPVSGGFCKERWSDFNLCGTEHAKVRLSPLRWGIPGLTLRFMIAKTRGDTKSTGQAGNPSLGIWRPMVCGPLEQTRVDQAFMVCENLW